MDQDDRDDIEELGLPPFVRDPAGILQRRWRWMLAALLAGLAATAWLAWTLKPRYRAAATVMIASQEIPKEFVRSTVGEDPFERINAMVGETLARSNLTELIEEFGLFAELREKLPMAEIVPRMRESINVTADRGIGSQRRNQTAQLLTIAYEDRVPATAAAVANRLADLFVEAGVRLRSQQARLTTEFLSRELTRAEHELREHDKKIAEFNSRYRGELPVDLEPSLRELERLEGQRQSLAIQIADAENRLATLSSASDSPDQRIQRMRAELAAELAIHTERHPDVESLRRQIAKLEEEYASGVTGAGEGSPRAAESRNIEQLRRQSAIASAKSREIEARVARIPERREQLEALKEKESVLRQTYTEFLRKVQEAELAESLEHAQQGGRVSVVERAQPPLYPSVSRGKYLAAGIVASLVLACGVAVLLELLNPVLLASGEARSVEGVPILGSVPRIV